MSRLSLPSAALVLLLPSAALAQFSPGARSVGMGGAGMVFSSGVDAVEWNPANLAHDAGWNVSLGEVGGAVLLSGVTFDEMREILEASGSGDPALVEDLPEGGLSLATVSEGFVTSRAASAEALPQPGSPIPSLGLAAGSFGLRIRSRVLGEATLSKDLADLIVNGFDPARTLEYRVGDTGFRTTSFSEVTAAYGTILGQRLALGVGLRYVKGHSLVEGRFFEPAVDLVNQTVEIPGVAIESAGGSGFGLDLGAALDLSWGFRVAASATNLVQRMTWDEDLIAHEATFLGCDDSGTPSCPNGDDFELDFSELVNRFQGRPIAPGSVSLPIYRTAEDLLPEAFFPTTLRAGIGWRSDGTTVELVGSSVSPRGRQKSHWDERMSLGLEQMLWILTLRGGAARGTDGLQVLSVGLGLGIGPVVLDVSGGWMSGGLDLTGGAIAPENVDYAGGHLTVSLQVRGGGR